MSDKSKRDTTCLVIGLAAAMVCMPAWAGPLTFYFTASVDDIVNGQNGQCYSNAVTISGTSGWGEKNTPARGPEVYEEADRLMEPYRRAFIAGCKAKATLRSEGSVLGVRNDNGQTDQDIWDGVEWMREREQIFVKI